MIHGEQRTRSIPVDAGKQNFRRREKFCIAHGWVDVFGIGGDLAWQRAHGKCRPTEPDAGGLSFRTRLKKAA